MKWLKYIGSVTCVLLALGTLPSAIAILVGLKNGQADAPAYFVGKLIAYIFMIVFLVLASVRLFKSARKPL